VNCKVGTALSADWMRPSRLEKRYWRGGWEVNLWAKMHIPGVLSRIFLTTAVRMISYYLSKFDLSIRIFVFLPQMSMTSAMNPSGTYHAHRERQRRRILSAAQELFDSRGIDRVTIAEIVTAAGIRASTLYEYFSNKDEIVWAIVEEFMVQGSESVREAIEKISGPALAKITALFQAFEDQLIQHPERVRFMAQFDAMYARDWSVERLLAVEDRIMPTGRFEALAALIREGVADGSLRSDLDPDLTMHSIMNAVIGIQRRLASLGNRVEQEYGQRVDLLFRETVRIILLGLRAT
jgi:AcrR family transcriptional regulator